MAKTIIAFAGAKESGKSTSAILLKSILDTQTKEIAFAAHLKNTCAQVFNIDINYFLDTKLKETELENYVHLNKTALLNIFKLFDLMDIDYDKYIRPHISRVFSTPRALLQYIGTEVLHPIDPLIHVKTALKLVDSNYINIITDLRFPQEFEALYKNPEFLPIYVDNKKAEANAATRKERTDQYGVVPDDNGYLTNNNEDVDKKNPYKNMDKMRAI